MGYVREQHSEECNKLFDQWQKAFKEYNEKWPDHCQDCHGAGGFAHPGTYWDPPDYEPCDTCLGNSKCPRCGKETFKDDTINVCNSCGFDVNNVQEVEPEADFCWGDCKDPGDIDY